jgi:hypothetical protein
LIAARASVKTLLRACKAINLSLDEVGDDNGDTAFLVSFKTLLAGILSEIANTFSHTSQEMAEDEHQIESNKQWAAQVNSYQHSLGS